MTRIGLEVDQWLVEGCTRLQVLDAGCGTGFVALQCQKQNATVVGLDLTLAMLRRAHGTLRSRLVQARAEAIPFAEESFDMILCRQVLHYTREAEALLEAARVLRWPGQLRLAEVTSHGEEDAAFWNLFRAMVQPLARRVHSPSFLTSLVELCGFRLEGVRHIVNRCTYDLNEVYRCCDLPYHARGRLTAWLRDATSRLGDTLKPSFDGDTVALNQCWTLLSCSKE